MTTNACILCGIGVKDDDEYYIINAHLDTAQEKRYLCKECMGDLNKVASLTKIIFGNEENKND